MHLVGVSVNVTGFLWWTCSLHQFQKVAILKYVVKLVIKPRIFSPVARQPALTWQEFSTQIVARGLKSYHPSMKRIRSPSTELWHILAVYNMICPYDLDLGPIFPKIGPRDPESVLNLRAYFEVRRCFRFWNIGAYIADLVACG